MFSTGFNLDPVKEVPAEVQEEAMDLCLDIDRRDLHWTKSLQGALRELDVAYQKELHNLIGTQNLERYFNFRAAQQKEIKTAVIKQPPTLVGEHKLLETRKRAIRNSHQFLQDINFDMARGTELREAYRRRLFEVIERHREKPDEPNYLVMPEDVPENIYNPWVVFGPPYPGWAWSYGRNWSDEPDVPSIARYLNSASGSIGSYTYTHVGGADDSDFAWARYKTGMRFWYRMPVAGLLEVWLHLQAVNTYYAGYFVDEWGWSDANCDQESHFFLQVIAPEVSAMRLSTVLDYRRTGTSAHWGNEAVDAGDDRWAHLFSTNAYAAGTWLLVEVGTQEWNHFWSNDVSIGSMVQMQWFMENAYLRSSGE